VARGECGGLKRGQISRKKYRKALTAPLIGRTVLSQRKERKGTRLGEKKEGEGDQYKEKVANSH